MSSKPESGFIRSVHAHLPPSVYRMKNNNPYMGGVADCWYSDCMADLWVEYKFVPKLPKTVDVPINLSALQLEWLEGRHNEGRNLAVIVGSPKGGVVFRALEWATPISSTEFTRRIKTRAELAAWIHNQVGVKH